MRGYARKRDANEKAIIAALRAVGAGVQQLDGKGVPDLLVTYANTLWLVEVKDGVTDTTRAHKRNDFAAELACLTPAQVEWWQTWPGSAPVIVTNAAEALAAIGAKRPDLERGEGRAVEPRGER